MGLQGTYTRFGLSSFRESTPDSDDTVPASSDNEETPSSNKLRKRPLKTRDNYGPPKTRRSRGNNRATSTTNSQASNKIIFNESSPWVSLRKQFVISFEKQVVIASRKDGSLVAVREISGPDTEHKLNMLECIQSERFLEVLEWFRFEGSHYIAFEHHIVNGEKFTVTLGQFALIKRYPSEWQLAFIIKQILDGLQFLASIGLEHGAITCKNILIGSLGSIKIAGQEFCHKGSFIGSCGSVEDIRGVGYVAMELMNKLASYGGSMKILDPSIWPLDSYAAQFLERAGYAESIKDLIEHPLLTCKGCDTDMEDIMADVHLAEFSAFKGCNVLPR